ncbi:hypothetical protein ACR6EC_05580 [Bacillus subtilis]|uniref:hypothetical protein n=1 Tax=Bacillus subtilis TaxID=1423 RepID=UPI003EBC2274
MRREIIDYLKFLMGAPFIKGYRLIGETHLHIQYYSEFEEFKSDHPMSEYTKEEFDQYFNENDTLKKLLVGESVRLLRQFSYLECVTIEIKSYDRVVVEVHSSRFILNKYFGFNIEDLSLGDNTWKSMFVDVYLADPAKRNELYEKIVCKFNQ